MSKTTAEEVRVLELTLHRRKVGHLAGFANGRTVLSFTPEFSADPSRPTLSLITHPDFPRSEKLLSKPWATNQRIHPMLSNLLPEGALRELLAQGLKVHVDSEFDLFSYLGSDLPGALIATPMAPKDVPPTLLSNYGRATAVSFDSSEGINRFSLAGVQMKFSMKQQDGRYNLPRGGDLGDWIIKTPSTRHTQVPANEYTAMSLAALAGVEIPEIRLIELDQLGKLPPINLPDEHWAFAIKRFDRDELERVHMEDFAQVFVKYPHEKYGSANYEQIGKVLYQYSGQGLADAQQFARRLLVNILLANGDAHLKNWSLLYPDTITPRLSPAYDIVTTRVYIENEREFALNLARTRQWYSTTMAHFQSWARKADVPWRAIKPHLDDTIERARTFWPEALRDLPMDESHKQTLTVHWSMLHKDFSL